MEIFADRDALALAAADLLAGALASPGPRLLVVTGGSTPGAVYDRLNALDADWAATIVTLTDDRWVEEASADSNAALVRSRLLTGEAAAARFLPLRTGAASPEADALAFEPPLRALLPAAAVLLGVGEDGHIASLFPADPDLAARLDPAGERLCVGVAMSGLAPFVPRMTLTARALLASGLIVIMITGEKKRAIIERVAADPAYHPPVSAILRQTRTPVRVVWAP